MKFVLILALALFAFCGQAEEGEKIALVLGGVPEPDVVVDFKSDLSALKEKLTAAHYDIKTAFEAASPGEKFTPATAQQKLNEISAAIESAKPGSQILILVDAHGGAATPNTLHITGGSDDTRVDLGMLEPLQGLAKDKGVRVGIVDMSCYSGLSLDLAKRHPETCVITSASRDLEGDEQFVKEFAHALKNGTSLEDSFLKARTQTPFGFPQISSPEGDRASEDLSLIQSTATDDLSDLKTSLRKATCDSENSLLLQVYGLYAALNQTSDLSPVKQLQLKQALSAYLEYRKTYLDELQYLNRSFDYAGFKISISDLMHLDQLRSALKTLSTSSNLGGFHKNFQDLQNAMPEIAQKAHELFENDPQFRRIALANANEKLTKGMGGAATAEERHLWLLAYQVVSAERSLYDEIYHSQKSTRSNACRDFKF